jgi:hypothetical protein
MTDNTEPAEERSSRSIGWGWVLWLCLLLVLYFLSVGPVLVWATKNPLPVGTPTYKALVIFYAPLDWAYKRSPVVNKLVGMYGHLWVPERYDSKGNAK